MRFRMWTSESEFQRVFQSTIPLQSSSFSHELEIAEATGRTELLKTGSWGMK